MLGTWKGAKPRGIPSIPTTPFPLSCLKPGSPSMAWSLFSILGWKVSV